MFYSYSSNLVPGDTNGTTADIFRKDTQTGAITLVSTASNGDQGNNESYDPSISADGRYVVFRSHSSNLVPGDTNGTTGDIFRKDTQTGAITLVSARAMAIKGIIESYHPSISADGRYVVFTSYVSNLVPGDTNGTPDIFRKDTQTGVLTLVSAASNNDQGNNLSYEPSISADGRYVVFTSHASNLVPGDTNGTPDIFRKDTQTGVITLVSAASNGDQGNNQSYHPSISANGQLVVFTSDANNLVNGDQNYLTDIFRHEIATGTTTIVSVTGVARRSRPPTARAYSHGDQKLSADGRYVVFYSYASNLVPGDTNGTTDIFRKDTQTVAITLVSAASNGDQGNNESYDPSISADGRYVVFYSYASNLVPGDTNGTTDIFRKDTQTGVITLA